MKLQNIVWKKILKASLVAVFTVAPLVAGVSISQAAPPDRAPANGYRNNDHGNSHDRRNEKDDKNKNDRNKYQSFTGRVSNVRGRQFNLRAGGTTYNVYASSRLPNGVNQNASVRVYGQRFGVNDIRNATVSVIRNTNNNNKHQTFTGVVTKVESNSKFEIRVGNQTYNVYPSGRFPSQIRKNDTVRVRGQRYGVNDIRNANVKIVHNDNNSNKFQNFTGTVTNVQSNSRFDVRIGNTTYNVYPSGNAAKRVAKGNVVRIRGQRYGVNDIRNANVIVIRNR